MLRGYFSLIKKVLPEKFGEKGRYLASLKTYGCQQNFADSEKICGILHECGFSFTDDETIADLIVFNTCAIRKHAEDRFIGNIGNVKKLKEKNKNLVTVVCGCITQQEEFAEYIRKTFPFVSLILGTNYIKVFPELLYKSLINETSFCFNELGDLSEIQEDVPAKRDNNIRASVPIMYGCNNFCSYCIVPYVRGRERSRRSENILYEVENLVKKGYKEILLLGQNVNSYGKGLVGDIDFSKLLRQIDKISGEYWVRFMTSHPKDVTKELIDTIADSKHIAPYLHLPVQSGNNKILEKMNRKYTRERYEEIIDYIKIKIPNIFLSTDIIVGFPGETQEEFLDTISLVKKVRYSLIYSFIYSKRSGTPAAKMDDPVPYKEKTERQNYLLTLQKKITEGLLSKLVGTQQKVLVESSDENRSNVFFARTGGNILTRVYSNGKGNLLGKFIDVKIIDSARTYLVSEI